MVPSYGTAEALGFIASSPTLRVIQTLEAGIDWLTDRVPEHVTLCNARGVRDTPVAEWVLAMLLAHGKGLFEAAERRTWKYWQPRELAGSTVLIVGHGSIGAALARRLRSARSQRRRRRVPRPGRALRRRVAAGAPGQGQLGSWCSPH